MQLAQHDIPAVILAGGQGRRIGGDKAMVRLGSRALWQHVEGRVAPQVSKLAVNGVGAFGAREVIHDETPGLGPLGGILAAMVWAQGLGARRVLTVAVDTPFLPPDLVARLSYAEAPVVAARTPDGVHGTTALWDVTLADDLRAALGNGTRKVTFWAQSVGQEEVRFSDATPPPFFNINTPEDLTRAKAWL